MSKITTIRIENMMILFGLALLVPRRNLQLILIKLL